MEKLNFEQMECVKGGDCSQEHLDALLAVVGTLCSIEVPVLFVIGCYGIYQTYKSYYDCLGIFG